MDAPALPDKGHLPGEGCQQGPEESSVDCHKQCEFHVGGVDISESHRVVL